MDKSKLIEVRLNRTRTTGPSVTLSASGRLTLNEAAMQALEIFRGTGVRFGYDAKTGEVGLLHANVEDEGAFTWLGGKNAKGTYLNLDKALAGVGVSVPETCHPTFELDADGDAILHCKGMIVKEK